MLKHYILFIFIGCATIVQAQPSSKKNTNPKQDSIKKYEFIKQIGNGFFPTKYINFDLRYLIKYNQYEGVRTGIGVITNDDFSKKYRVNSYVVYGFKDHRFKYSIGGGFRLAKKSNTWANFSYTDDLQESGSSKFLTDKRFFQFFEPRLLKSEQITILQVASLIRSASAFAENPAKTTECIAPIRAQAKTEIPNSATIGI